MGCLCDDGAALDDPINMVTSVALLASAMRRLGFELINSELGRPGELAERLLESGVSSSAWMGAENRALVGCVPVKFRRR